MTDYGFKFVNSVDNSIVSFLNTISSSCLSLVDTISGSINWVGYDYISARLNFFIGTWSILLAKASFAFLLISMFFYWLQTTFKYTKNTFVGKIPLLSMYLANITLALMLTERWFESGHFPLSNLYESLLFLSWSLTSIHLFLENTVNKGDQIASTLTLGAITSPLSLFTDAFATFSLPQEMQKATVLVPALQSNWLIMHVSVMIISYAALLSGSLLAMAFLVIKFVDESKFNNLSSDSSRAFLQSSPLPASPLLAVPKVMQSQEKAPFHAILLAKLRDRLDGKQSKGTEVLLKKLETDVPLTKAQSYKTDIDALEVEQLISPINSIKSPNSLDFNVTKLGTSLTLQTKELYLSDKQASVAEQGHCLVLQGKGNAKDLINPGFSTFYPKTTQLSGSKELAEQAEGSLVLEKTLQQTLDNLSYRSIGLGFALLTIGILSGAVWANEAWGSYWSWDPKETWAFVTWLVFAFYLHTRLSKGWVGKKSAYVAIFGFVIIWFCYLGVNLLGKGLHSYGWFHIR